jgi:Fic family protein
MARIVMRKVKGKRYYYLEESVKQGKKWVKKSIYLGNSVPGNETLMQIYQKFEENLRRRGITGIAPPFTEFITRGMATKLEKAAKGKVVFLESLSQQQRAAFIRRERITFVTDSNAIEGSTLDYWLTERVIAGQDRMERLQKRGVIITNMGREEREALNLNKCLDAYEKLLANNTELDEEIILRLHYILLSKIEGYEKYRGVWRPVNVMIRGSSHVFPHHTEVPGLMRNLLTWYKKNEKLVHPIELAAKFHTKFTTIHPFADGNGRMARLLMNYILQLNGFPFTNIPLRRRSSYMRTQAAGNRGEQKPFVLFLADEIIKQNKRLKTR